MGCWDWLGWPVVGKDGSGCGVLPAMLGAPTFLFLCYCWHIANPQKQNEKNKYYLPICHPMGNSSVTPHLNQCSEILYQAVLCSCWVTKL